MYLCVRETSVCVRECVCVCERVGEWELSFYCSMQSVKDRVTLYLGRIVRNEERWREGTARWLFPALARSVLYFPHCHLSTTDRRYSKLHLRTRCRHVVYFLRQQSHKSRTFTSRVLLVVVRENVISLAFSFIFSLFMRR